MSSLTALSIGLYLRYSKALLTKVDVSQETLPKEVQWKICSYGSERDETMAATMIEFVTMSHGT